MRTVFRFTALTLVAGLLPCHGEPASLDMAPVTPSQVQTVLANELPAWRLRLPFQGPRTFLEAEQWQRLPTRMREAQPKERALFDRALTLAEELIRQPLPVYRLPETFVTEKFTWKQAAQENWQRGIGDQIVLLSFALRLRDEAALRERLRELVLLVCRFPTWGVSNGEGWKEPANADLAAGHISRGVAIGYDWHREIWSEEERHFIRETVKARVSALLRGLYGGMFWANQYTQNHNHVSAAGLGVSGLVFLDEIPEAAEWLAAAVVNFDTVVRSNAADGGSTEGLSYWTYGLSFILQFIEAVRPMIPPERYYGQVSLRNSAKFRLASSTTGFAGVLLFGDSPGRDFQGPHHLLRKLGSVYRDGEAQALADCLPFPPRGTPRGDVPVWEVLWFDASLEPAPLKTLDYHAEQTGLTSTRSGWSSSDYLLAIKSGFTNRNHGHLDAGAIVFGYGEDWLIRTPGYGLMQGQTGFHDRSGPRWGFLSNSTEAQATLLIDGKNQRFDPAACGRVTGFLSTGSWCGFDIDLTEAYSEIESIHRTILHRRGEYVLIFDRIAAAQEKEASFLLQVPPNHQRPSAREIGLSAAHGGLVAHAIQPSPDFVPYAPISPIINLPPDRQRTLSVTQRGRQIHFLTWLEPRASAAEQPVWQSQPIMEQNYRGTRLCNSKWDDIALFSLDDQMRKLAVDQTAVLATAVAMHRDPTGTCRSLFALSTTTITLPEWEALATSPVTVQLERLSAGVWLMLADQAVSWTLTGGSKIQIDAWSEGDPTDGKAYLIHQGNLADAMKTARDHFTGSPSPR